jgi:AcrR family transcriptional regulator
MRRAWAETTRWPILAAVGALVGEAGVQGRTVHRHFPTRDALLDAFWVWIDARAGFTAFPEGERDLVERPRVVFAGFDRVEGIVRGSLSSRHGRDLRLRVNEERRTAFRRCQAEATRGLDPAPARPGGGALPALLRPGTPSRCRGTCRTATGTRARPVRMLAHFDADLEAFFRAAGTPGAAVPATPPTAEEIGRVMAARHSVAILGPHGGAPA